MLLTCPAGSSNSGILMFSYLYFVSFIRKKKNRLSFLVYRLITFDVKNIMVVTNNLDLHFSLTTSHYNISD